MDLYTYIFTVCNKVLPQDKAHEVALYVIELPHDDPLYQDYLYAFEEKIGMKKMTEKSIRYLNRKEEVLNQN